VLRHGLRAAVADNEVITLVNAGLAAHRINLAFHRDAVGFAMRTLQGSKLDEIAGTGNMRSMQDSVSGLVLRLELIRQYKQWVWDLDALWGVNMVRPELAIRIASTP